MSQCKKSFGEKIFLDIWLYSKGTRI